MAGQVSWSGLPRATGIGMSGHVPGRQNGPGTPSSLPVGWAPPWQDGEPCDGPGLRRSSRPSSWSTWSFSCSRTSRCATTTLPPAADIPATDSPTPAAPSIVGPLSLAVAPSGALLRATRGSCDERAPVTATAVGRARVQGTPGPGHGARPGRGARRDRLRRPADRGRSRPVLQDPRLPVDGRGQDLVAHRRAARRLVAGRRHHGHQAARTGLRRRGQHRLPPGRCLHHRARGARAGELRGLQRGGPAAGPRPPGR